MKLCWLPFKTCSRCCGIREIVFNWCIMCQINEIMLVAMRMCSCCGSISKINFIWCMTQHGNEIMMVAMMSCKCGHHVINIIFTLMRGRPYQWNHWLSIKQVTGAAAPAKLPSLDAQCAMLWNHDNLKMLPLDPLHWQKHLHLMGDVPYQWNHAGCHEDMQLLPLHHLNTGAASPSAKLSSIDLICGKRVMSLIFSQWQSTGGLSENLPFSFSFLLHEKYYNTLNH